MVLGFDENPCFPVLFERGTHWRGTRGENIVNCRNSLLCWAFRIRGRPVTPKSIPIFGNDLADLRHRRIDVIESLFTIVEKFRVTVPLALNLELMKM